MKYIAVINEKEYEIEIDQENQITVNGETYEVDYRLLPEDGIISLLLKNRSLEAVVDEKEDDIWEILTHGELYSVKVQDEPAYRLSQSRGGGLEDGDAAVKSPMPGLIVAVHVTEGDTVHKGDKVVILESMKMENELKAPIDGVVARVNVGAGDSVEKGQVLVFVHDPAADEAPEE
jgi:biotin carboxyl carrier protein